METTPDNLVLELLRRMHSEMAEMRTEMRDRFGRIEMRLGVIEQHQAAMLQSITYLVGDRDTFETRLARVERRLELREDTKL